MTACAKTVLLVDDSSTARRIESLLLKQKHVRRGYEAGSSDYTKPINGAELLQRVERYLGS